MWDLDADHLDGTGIVVPEPHGRLQAELDALTARLGRDHTRLARQGPHLTGWGPDTDTVRLDLDPYSGAAARRLLARYGDMLSVEPESVGVGG